MPAHRTPRWSAAEMAVLREHYPAQGIDVAEHLPGRSWHSIHVKAHKLGLHCTRLTNAPKPKLAGADLDQAIALRENEGWSFARIGAKFGVCEAAANNAVLIALCTRRGFTPAQRDTHGRLTDEGRERVRLALKKGLKGCDIQLRLGVSAACVAEQRRRYNADLKARGKALLPPPGGGAAYSGVKVPKAKRAEAEALFLQGLGTLKISQRTGLSKTSCTRLRTRLIRRLAKKGEALPGCDITGARHVQAESSRFVPPAASEALRCLLLDRMPVLRAARLLAIGMSTAYRTRDALAAELAAQGKTLPAPILPGRVKTGTFAEADWPPQGARAIYAFRALLADMPFDQARERWRADRRAEREAERAARIEAQQRPMTFEDQLARVAAGAGLQRNLSRAHLEPKFIPERTPA